LPTEPKKLGVKRFMNVFVARQPIFDKLKRVVAYELLFRSGFENFFSANDGDAASQTVMSGAVHIFGLASLTSGKPVFINFTRSLLLSGLAFVLPPTQLVVELLETVEPDDEVLNACKELRRHGYLIGREVPSHKLAYFRLIQELNQPELDFSAVEAILKSDLSLSLKLLRYINSAAIGLRYPVTSLRQAMVLLGEQNFRRWALLALATSLLEDKPQELILTGVIRGRFCELICQRVGWRILGVDPFLIGFLSVLDALLDQPLPQLLDELPIAPEIKDALSGRPTLLGFVYNLVIAYERADWEKVSELIGKVGLSEGEVTLLYAEAVAWADTLFRQIPL